MTLSTPNTHDTQGRLSDDELKYLLDTTQHRPQYQRAFRELIALRAAKPADGWQGQAVLLRSYLAWAVAQIEIMNDDQELSVSEWAEDAAMFWQAKQMANGVEIEHLLHEDLPSAPKDTSHE